MSEEVDAPDRPDVARLDPPFPHRVIAFDPGWFDAEVFDTAAENNDR